MRWHDALRASALAAASSRGLQIDHCKSQNDDLPIGNVYVVGVDLQ